MASANSPLELKARIFISCGQQDNSNELEVATRVAQRLDDLGYIPYVATQVQSLGTIKENVFEQLSNTEYFLFIDFKRERLTKSPEEYRGSLFSNQELAIASYLHTPVLAFREKGVRESEGLLGFIQGNCHRFSDRNSLHRVISDHVKELWTPTWMNSLQIELPKVPFTKVDRSKYGKSDYYFLEVKNLHRHKAARNCFAYLERAVQLPSGTPIKSKLVESKWTGYVFPSVTIAPGGHRSFDTVVVAHEHPNYLQFSMLTDTIGQGYGPLIKGPSEVELGFVVYSDNFEPVRSSLKVTIGKAIEDFTIEIS